MTRCVGALLIAAVFLLGLAACGGGGGGDADAGAGSKEWNEMRWNEGTWGP
ncbi:MAG: hypothetical protein QNJ98_00515 [Planctomycetota bacterium]|nr:hypothetical protein [Planctomycetota bacterium]